MTKSETIKAIESLLKPYRIIEMHQSTYWMTLSRIKKGTCSPATEAKFFERFGYVRTKEAEYEINEFPPK